MSIDRQTSSAIETQPPPIDSPIGAWMVASTLEAHLSSRHDLTPEKARLLRQMALDLSEWLEGAAA